MEVEVERGSERVGEGVENNLFIDDKAKARYESSKGRKCLSTKVFKSDSVENLKFDYLLKYFKLHHLDGLLTLDNPVYLEEVNQFYANFRFDDGVGEYVTRVRGVDLTVTKFSINEAIGCPYVDSSHLKPTKPDGPIEMFIQQTFKPPTSSLPLDPAKMGEKNTLNVGLRSTGKRRIHIQCN
jgi:hypothetical protein